MFAEEYCTITYAKKKFTGHSSKVWGRKLVAPLHAFLKNFVHAIYSPLFQTKLSLVLVCETSLGRKIRGI